MNSKWLPTYLLMILSLIVFQSCGLIEKRHYTGGWSLSLIKTEKRNKLEEKTADNFKDNQENKTEIDMVMEVIKPLSNNSNKYYIDKKDSILFSGTWDDIFCKSKVKAVKEFSLLKNSPKDTLQRKSDVYGIVSFSSLLVAAISWISSDLMFHSIEGFPGVLGLVLFIAGNVTMFAGLKKFKTKKNKGFRIASYTLLILFGLTLGVLSILFMMFLLGAL